MVVITIVSHARQEFEGLNFGVDDLSLSLKWIRGYFRMIKVSAVPKPPHDFEAIVFLELHADINVTVVRQGCRECASVCRNPRELLSERLTEKKIPFRHRRRSSFRS